MRIKTSKNVLEMLPEVKDFLGFENNAQVLKLAVSFSINEDEIDLPEVVDDGFEIDSGILFGDEEEYYLYLLQKKFNQEVTRHLCSQVIEYGMEKVRYYTKISKTFPRFIKMVVEELCI